MNEKIIMIFKRNNTDGGIDIEVPADIKSSELIYGLNQAFHLGINMDNPNECYMRAENPIALVRGEAKLDELGLRNGTILYAVNTD